MRGANGAEAAGALGRSQEVEVDLDVVHLLHAADVRVAELLVRIEELTAAGGTRGRIHHLVAVDAAPPALDLVLRVER